MKLHVDFNEVDSELAVRFIQTECTFHTDFGEVFFINTSEIYEGDYEVTPRVYEQTLPTKDKVLLDDVTVHIIPLSKTINFQNGYTVTIG